MTMSDIFLWLGIVDLGLGAAMVACVFLVANLVPDVERVSQRTANLMAAFWRVGPWLLWAAIANFVVFMLVAFIERNLA
jgi:hypothetical protein